MNNSKEVLNDSFLKENKLIFKKYKPIRQIGKGSFGTIYLVTRLDDKNNFAMKTELTQVKDKYLESEAYSLLTLQGFGIPKFISYGHNQKHNILIEELLGKSLHDIFFENNRKANLIDICLIGIQILDRLEWIHSKNMVYIDIKPENFLFGQKDFNILYVIDFAFCKKYRSSKTGKHILPKINRTFSGTIKYLSINSLRGKQPSRRDDLISLGYMLIYLYKKELPWDFYITSCDREKIIELMNLKLNNGNGKLFENLPDEIIEYIKYTKNMKFEQTPDYSYLRSLFKKIISNKKLIYKNLSFSWIISNKKIFDECVKNRFIRKSNSHSRLYKNIQKSSLNRNKINLSQNNNIKKFSNNSPSSENNLNIIHSNKTLSEYKSKNNSINNSQNIIKHKLTYFGGKNKLKVILLRQNPIKNNSILFDNNINNNIKLNNKNQSQNVSPSPKTTNNIIKKIQIPKRKLNKLSYLNTSHKILTCDNIIKKLEIPNKNSQLKTKYIFPIRKLTTENTTIKTIPFINDKRKINIFQENYLMNELNNNLLNNIKSKLKYTDNSNYNELNKCNINNTFNNLYNKEPVNIIFINNNISSNKIHKSPTSNIEVIKKKNLKKSIINNYINKKDLSPITYSI